jgi:hypothetical protein
MEMPGLLLLIDPYLIWWYRITGHGALDFFLGTVVLSLLSLLLGEASVFLASLAGKKYTRGIASEAARYQKLSLDALAAGDRPAYEAANRLANEAFGKSFFLQLAQSAAFFWSVGLALAWMQHRFAGVEFPLPLTGFSLSYAGVFLPIYILVYLAYKRAKKKLSQGTGIGATDLPGVPSATWARGCEHQKTENGERGFNYGG